MNYGSFLKFLAVLVLLIGLSACEDSEERAERHFQSGMELLESGDVERALIEFRNVFKLNGTHKEARQTYAKVVREQGKLREAFGQYLRLAEQYPEDIPARIALAELSFQFGNWDEFDRHSAIAIEAMPDNPAVQIISAIGEYRAAIVDEDPEQIDAAFEDAEALAAANPENELLRRILIDGYVRTDAFESALTVIDAMLADTPANRDLQNLKLSIFAELQDTDRLEAHLLEMTEIFPEDAAIKEQLIRYYLSRGQRDRAEDFLREIGDPAAEDPTFFLTLVQFLLVQYGPEAGLEELDRAIASVEDSAPFEALKASVIFQQGNQEEAIAAMERIIVTNEPSDQLRRIKIALAKMLIATGNKVGAQRLVSEVLEQDSSQVDALKLTAGWQIEQDETDEAIATLRIALDQAPQDYEAMTLMAEAFEREGNRQLALDFLSLAAETSGQAPDESLRLARLLANQERFVQAERAVVSSLRLNPGNEALLTELGRIYVLLEDLPRISDVARELRLVQTDSAQRTANALEATVVEKQSGTEAAIEFLEDLTLGSESDGDLSARFAIIRAKIASGETDSALEDARSILEENPQSPQARALMAATQAAAGNLETAESLYRELVIEFPQSARLWIELIRVVSFMGRSEDARAITDEGLAANPTASDLLWAKAGYLEQDGEPEKAIAIYEQLYDQNSGSIIVANNLASLLATYRSDEESLARAATISRRLKDVEQPAFQDTYGWIAFLQNDLPTAQRYLEAAAAGLPNDPIVQFHLAEVYRALGRADDAKIRYEAAVRIAGPNDARADIEKARERLEE